MPLVPTLFHEPPGQGGMTGIIVAIFAAVYVGMFLGGLPRLKLDRAGVALLGAIGVIGLGAMSTEQAARAVDLPTILLLFSFMVVSAQMRLGGFYGAVTRRVASWPLSRAGLLAALIAVAGALSAVFSNDIICLAMTPVVARRCLRRGLAPVPFLVGLACAANIGSAATLIGNTQNMLIGSIMRLPFGAYMMQALPPVLLSLVVLWAWLVWGPGSKAAAVSPTGAPRATQHASGDEPPFDRWQTAKRLTVAAALMGAGVLLLSRRFHSSQVMSFVDWELLVLFMGLFVVNHAFESTGLAAQVAAMMANQGVHPEDPKALLVIGMALSNLFSNVPAVMLLLPQLSSTASGVLLALVSTLSGNLLLVGSIANLIVADLARESGITIDWKGHAVIGAPVTLGTLVIVWGWMALLGAR